MKLLLLLLLPIFSLAQYDAKYVHNLYSKYPSIKSNLCSSCKEWDNPYYKSIADTEKHMPLVTYYVYTKEHMKMQEDLNIPRTGIYASWNVVDGQSKLNSVYLNFNKKINKPKSVYEIVYGHCQAWILLAWCRDAAILSNTEDFNEGMEYQGQNIGTEIASENLCRNLIKNVTDSIKIWCGTYGSISSFSYKNITVNVPFGYWKIVDYYDNNTKTNVEKCYLMPNDYSEDQSKLENRLVDFSKIVSAIDFDPKKVLHD